MAPALEALETAERHVQAELLALLQQRDALAAQINQKTEALSAIEAAKKALGNPAESPKRAPASIQQAVARTAATSADEITDRPHRRERAIPPAFRQAVVSYIENIGRQFTLHEIRDVLRRDPNNFTEDETGDVLTSALRRLESEGIVVIEKPGRARRPGIYRPASLPAESGMFHQSRRNGVVLSGNG